MQLPWRLVPLKPLTILGALRELSGSILHVVRSPPDDNPSNVTLIPLFCTHQPPAPRCPYGDGVSPPSPDFVPGLASDFDPPSTPPEKTTVSSLHSTFFKRFL